MANLKAFSLRIFVVDGDPDGLRLVERSNWNGIAVVFPRVLLNKVKEREEINKAGVYILIGQDDEGEIVYIGEGDPIAPRFDSHAQNKEFWHKAVFFISSRELNKAHVQFLEARLLKYAREAKRVSLDNRNQPNEPTLSEADRADMEVFLHNMLEILPILGVYAFEQPNGYVQLKNSPKPQSNENEGELVNELLYCSGKRRGSNTTFSAQGYQATQGFIVLAKSQAATELTPSYPDSSKHLREKLIKAGVLVEENGLYLFTQNYTFSTPSTAAKVVLGRSANGWKEWENAQGISLRDLNSTLRPSQTL